MEDKDKKVEQIEADEDVANLNYENGKQEGRKEVVEIDRGITEHILQDGDGNWSVESWRLKTWFAYRQAFLKEREK